MIPPDANISDPGPGHAAPSAPSGARPAVRFVRAGVLGIIIVMLGGGAAGFWGAHQADGGGAFSPAQMAIAVVAGVILVIAVGQVVIDARALRGAIAAMPRRERASTTILLWCMAVGGAIGVGGWIVSGVAQGSEDWFFGETRTMPALLAVGLTIPVLTILPWVTWRWWRTIDEHEQAAYADGANVAVHFVMLAGFAWWLLSRARLVPEPDAMVLIAAMTIVWTAVWLYRKYH